jgi:hypothetical protein
MNDDVPARDAEGQTSFYVHYAEKTAQSLYAQLGLRQLVFETSFKLWWSKRAPLPPSLSFTLPLPLHPVRAGPGICDTRCRRSERVRGHVRGQWADPAAGDWAGWVIGGAVGAVGRIVDPR